MRITAQSMSQNYYLTQKIAQGSSASANTSMVKSILNDYAAGTSTASEDLTGLATQFNTLKTNGKTITSYYDSVLSGKYKASSVSAANSSKTGSVSDTDSKVALQNLSSAASELSKSATTLSSGGFHSVFRKDDSGEYDTDGIYNAVQSFVADYNTIKKDVVDTANSSALQTAVNMVDGTASKESLLNDIGISINSDNTLSVNKETFQSADMNKVKSLFNGTGSYAYEVARQASQIKSYADAATVSNPFSSFSTKGTGSIIDTLA